MTIHIDTPSRNGRGPDAGHRPQVGREADAGQRDEDQQRGERSSTGRRACRRSAAATSSSPRRAERRRRRRSRSRTTAPRARPCRTRLEPPAAWSLRRPARPRLRAAASAATAEPRRAEQDRQDREVARQLDDRGHVPGRRREGKAGRHDLGGVVDREPGPRPERRIATARAAAPSNGRSSTPTSPKSVIVDTA